MTISEWARELDIVIGGPFVEFDALRLILYSFFHKVDFTLQHLFIKGEKPHCSIKEPLCGLNG